MAIPDTPLDPGAPKELHTHRRLLLGFTFALAAIHALDITFGKTLSVQGATAQIGHPGGITPALWVAYLWSLWRYWQREHLYRPSRFDEARQTMYVSAVRAVIQRTIAKGVNDGLYADRGLAPGMGFDVNDRGLAKPAEDWSQEPWEFPNVSVSFTGRGGAVNTRLEGGANCSLDIGETRRLRRRIERELLLGHPHFADWKLPYWLAALAPVALVVDLFRAPAIALLQRITVGG